MNPDYSASTLFRELLDMYEYDVQSRASKVAAIKAAAEPLIANVPHDPTDPMWNATVANDVSRPHTEEWPEPFRHLNINLDDVTNAEVDDLIDFLTDFVSRRKEQ